MHFLDPYSRRAQLRPALLALLPILVTTVAVCPEVMGSWHVFAGILVYAGLTTLIAQLGRDRGRQKQSLLYALWGGKPTTQFLRHRDSPIDRITLKRYHQALGRSINCPFPSAQEEQANPASADEVYESGVRFLLEHSRDRARFSLVFVENVNYGFRRNLWGMKPIGISLAVAGLLLCTMPAFHLWGRTYSPAYVVAVLLDLGLLVVWVTWIHPIWVKTAAEAYALRLLAVCEGLDAGRNDRGSSKSDT